MRNDNKQNGLKRSEDAKTEHDYFRVVVMWTDGSVSANRVYKDRSLADKWAARQAASPLVKKVKIEPFTRNQFDWKKSKR